MDKAIRRAFERVTYPSFPGSSHGLRRKQSGEYVSDSLEDHWQTFQEAWECAVEWMANKDNPLFSDDNNKGRWTHDDYTY